MNVLDAAHSTGHEYPGGVTALCTRMGISYAVLNSKLNPNTSTHHLTLLETMRMQALTGDHRILQAMAEELGYIAMRLPSCDDDDFGLAAMRSVKEFGMFIGACEESLMDGKVTQNELRRIESELLKTIAHASRLHQLMAAKQKQVRR